jgi:hypothetical protein
MLYLKALVRKVQKGVKWIQLRSPSLSALC